MKLYFLTIPLFLLSISCKQKETTTPIEQLKKDVYYLANDSLEGREIGTKGEKIAADYISKRYEAIGLEAHGNSFLHPIERKGTNPHDSSTYEKLIKGNNIIGFINNNSKRNMIIGAHYDHLGWGEEGSLHIDESNIKAIHNGADDNASGVSALFYIANKLKNQKLNHNIYFIAFTGEEKGLWGSKYLVNQDSNLINLTDAMINMDMVGRLDSNNRLAIYGVGTSPSFIPALEDLNQKKQFSFKYDSSGIGPSDHTSFYLENIPVLHFFTGQHEDYHKPTDDAEKINFKGLEKVSDFITKLILKLDGQEKIVFTKTKEKKKKSRTFNVTLGVIPDYLFDGKGMKIDGLKDDRPAKNAGLEKGDVVIKMGDKNIQSMNDYMDALGEFEAEQTIEITIQRGSEELTKSLTFD